MKLRERILAIAIAILLVIFVYYGIQTFYPEPKYNNYCNSSIVKPYAPAYEGNASLCKPVFDRNQQNETQCADQGGITRYTMNSNGCSVATSCDMCSKHYNDAMEYYNGNVFIATIIIGIIAVVLGAVFLSLESVGSGIMGGGVITLIYGTLRYWGSLSDLVRFVILGVALAILIWLGYKKLQDTGSSSSSARKKRKK